MFNGRSDGRAAVIDGTRAQSGQINARENSDHVRSGPPIITLIVSERQTNKKHPFVESFLADL